MMKVFLPLVAMIFSANLVKPDDICTPKQPNPSDPRLPAVDYSYVTEVVSKLVEQKRIMLQYINHDAKNNMMSVATKYAGWNYGYIWNTKSLDGHWYNESSCVSYQANKITGEGQVLEMIFSATAGTWVYEGTATLRGQTLNLWSSCMKGTGYIYKSYYYFNQDNAPFRYVTQGKVNGYTTNVIKDFFKFVKIQPDPNAFKTPAGLYCTKDTAYANPLPMSASYNQEVIIPTTKTVKSSKVVYDKSIQVSFDNMDNATNIKDYQRGIKFIIQDGVCTREVMSRMGTPDQAIDSKGNVHMATLGHFLLTDGKLIYNGQDIVRGIPVDVYTRSSRSAEQYGSINSLVLYMAQKKVKMYNNDGYVNSVINPLVRIQYNSGRPPVVRTQIEISDFQGGQLPLDYPFKMDACYAPNETIRFNLYVNSSDTQTSYDVRARVAEGILTNICKTLSIPFLRVQMAFNGETTSAYNFLNNQIVIPALIYARESAPVQFSEHINLRQPVSKGESFTDYDDPGNTPTLCAEYCVNITSRPFDSKEWCYSFMFDRASKRCTFLHTSYFKRTFESSFTIDWYQRSYSRYTDYKTSQQIWTDIQTAVKAGSVVYSNKDQNNKVLGVYKAVKVKETEEADYFLPEADDPTMHHFFPLGVGEVISGTPVESLDSVTQRACALRCLNSLKYYCKGYHHVENIKQSTCQLYDKVNTETLSDYQQKNKAAKQKPIQETDIYKIRDLFQQFRRIGGKTMLMDSTDYVYTDIDSHGCAELCLRNTQIFCQSFESCGNVCLLDSRHIFNSPKSSLKTNKECTHFSRVYIEDYVKVPNKKALADSSVIELKAISVQQCAHVCSTSPDYQCNVFEYCDTISSCLIVPKQVDLTSQLSYKTTGTCDMYKRRPHINRAVNSQSSQSANGRYSSGAMGGMAIGMIILGCVLVIAIGILVLRLRSSEWGDGSVRFGRNHLSEDE